MENFVKTVQGMALLELELGTLELVDPTSLIKFAPFFNLNF